MKEKTAKERKKEKSTIKLKDLKPAKDAKGGRHFRVYNWR
jgi:hypothetical protein